MYLPTMYHNAHSHLLVCVRDTKVLEDAVMGHSVS